MTTWYAPFLQALKIFAVEVLTKVAKDLLPDALAKLSKDALYWWSGKRFAVLGQTAVGKNSLLNRLRGQPFAAEYVQTRGVNKVAPFKLNYTLPDGTKLQFTCNALNVGGEQDARDGGDWRDACKGADVIFYMIALKDLEEQNFEEGSRIHDDLKWLAVQMKDLAPTARVHVLVNKIDVGLVRFKNYEQLASAMQPALEVLQKTAKEVFGPYHNRLTGVTPTSMKDEHQYATSFYLALQCVYEAVRK